MSDNEPLPEYLRLAMLNFEPFSNGERDSWGELESAIRRYVDECMDEFCALCYHEQNEDPQR